MLCLWSYLLVWSASSLAAQVGLSASNCGAEILLRYAPNIDTFTIDIDAASNQLWTEMRIAVLVTNRTDNASTGVGAQHSVTLTPSMPLHVQSKTLPIDEGLITTLTIKPESVGVVEPLSIKVEVQYLMDKQGCFTTIGKGLLTRVSIPWIDKINLPSEPSSMCPHTQHTECIRLSDMARGGLTEPRQYPQRSDMIEFAAVAWIALFFIGFALFAGCVVMN